jgi:argininosuccinate lyase
MHSGRSRQDIIPTILKLEQRDRLLDFIDALNGARAKFIELAAKNAEVIVPAKCQRIPFSTGRKWLFAWEQRGT